MKKEKTPKYYYEWYRKSLLAKIANLLGPCYFFGEEIPQETKFIVSNHLHFFDPIFLILHFDKYTKFVAKKETKKIPIISRVFDKIDSIYIDREKEGGDINAVRGILRAVKNGDDIVIFPEGTRNRTGTTNLQPLKEGTALFALKTGAMVLPIMIYKKHKLFRRNYLYVGKPFDFKQYAGQKADASLLNEATNILYNKMLQAKTFMDEYMANDGAKKLKKLYKEQRKEKKTKNFVIKID